MRKNYFKALAAMVLGAALVLPGATAQAATTYQCESIAIGGSYAGRISSPFSGVALYANNDYVSVGGIYLSNSSTTISVRGASNNYSTASVTVKLNGYSVGTLSFSGTTPSTKSITITPQAGTYTVQLVVTSDTGSWDAYVDYMTISNSSNSSSGNTSGSTGGTTSGSKGNVYLCFDDGPTNGYTSTIIRNLKNAGCNKATFFVWGSRVSSNASGWSALVNSGFSLQNHSYSHSYMTSWTYQQVYNDLNKCNQVIVNAGKAKPTKVRLPYLSSNSTILSACSQLGLSVVNPSVDTKDWNGASTSQIINACNNLQAGGNTLMHDGYSSTASAVSSIVTNLKNKGFGFAQY